jgi:hypothetical protein
MKPTKKKAEKPLPCPWCGSKPKIGCIGGFSIKCETDECVCQPSTDYHYATREEAIKAWNKRRSK